MYGQHHNFDDPKYWSFSRNSGLPVGYFDKPKLGYWWGCIGVVVVVVSFMLVMV